MEKMFKFIEEKEEKKVWTCKYQRNSKKIIIGQEYKEQKKIKLGLDNNDKKLKREEKIILRQD